MKLTSPVKRDCITDAIVNAFDYDPYESGVVVEIDIPQFPDEFQIGVIVGSSGSGKSTILKHAFGYSDDAVAWDNAKCIASNFNTEDEAMEKLGAVGLNSIPTWLKPRNVLSTGEGFRADLARVIGDGAVIDEFTSVVNRDVAKSCSMSLEKYIRAKNLNRVVFATCHDDIIPYLRPDWVYNTDTHEFYSGRYLCRPKIVIRLFHCGRSAWDIFKRHHYLSGALNSSARCYLGCLNDSPVAFGSVISMPCGSLEHAFREHRTVVLPDFQGMGIGNLFSEAIADAYHRAGCRYFSKTANPRCGEHRDKSPLWKPTSKNHKSRNDYTNMTKDFHGMLANAQTHATRVCYSHEYIGDGKTYDFTYLNNGIEQMTLYDFGIESEVVV